MRSCACKLWQVFTGVNQKLETKKIVYKVYLLARHVTTENFQGKKGKNVLLRPLILFGNILEKIA